MNNIPALNTVQPKTFRKPVGKKLRAGKKSPKNFFIFAATIFSICIVLALAYIIHEWYVTHTFKWQSPIIVQTPLIIKRADVQAIVSPVGKKKKLSIFDVGAISDKIYTLESSNGKNDGCRALGLYNGYGWNQNSFTWKCYSSHEQVREMVIAWLEQHIKAGDIESALCNYNQGKIEQSCTYSINYKSL